MFFLIGSLEINAQVKITPSLGISETFSARGTYNTSKAYDFYEWEGQYGELYPSGTGFLTTNISAGIRTALKHISVGTSLQYQLLRTGNEKNNRLFSNLLGAEINIRFLDTKKVRPNIIFELSTEMASNYKEKYLSTKVYYPVKFDHVTLPGNFNSSANIYRGTPFVFHVVAGCDFRLSDHFSINVGIGYGVRMLRSIKANLTFNHNQSKTDPIKTEYISEPYTVAFHMLDFQIGLNYAFSFHKKEKKADE